MELVGEAQTASMGVLLWGLVGFAVLGFVHIGVQGLVLKAQAGNEWSVGPRDVMGKAGPLSGRLRRALDNFLESAPIFLALAVVALWTGRENTLLHVGMTAFLLGRAAFLPAYASGVPWLRTGCWHVASIGLVCMFVGLFWT